MQTPVHMQEDQQRMSCTTEPQQALSIHPLASQRRQLYSGQQSDVKPYYSSQLDTLQLLRAQADGIVQAIHKIGPTFQ